MSRRERVSNRLQLLREARPLTQEEVGRFMGLDMTTVSKHESGTRRMSAEQATRYAGLYRCSLLELFLDPRDVFEHAG